MTPTTPLRRQLRDLSSAEEFFDLFEVPYDPRHLAVVRLHVLQRLHAVLAAEALEDADDDRLADAYRRGLRQAYREVVEAAPEARRDFAVFQRARAREAERFVTLAGPKGARR